MKRTIMAGAVIMGLLGAQGVLAGGDAAAGKAKAGTCAGCHGAKGISGSDMYPNLAGQKAGYIVRQLKAFKSGARNNPMMKPMASMLSDKDMENVAAYFASLGHDD